MTRTMILGALLATVSPAVFAQSLVQPVSDRVAADNAPLGVRAGSFLVIPKVDVDVAYNDNIYATENNTKSDIITSIRPEVAARSNWNRHALNAVVRTETQRYADHDAENQNNLTAALDGRLDVMRDTSIGGGVSYDRAHEDRGNPNAVGTSVKPTEYNTTTGKLGVYRGLGKANARLDTEAKHIDYKNGYTSTGGLVNNNLRDRNEYAQTLRLGYQFDPRFEAFVKGTMDNRVYDIKTTNRSSRGQTYVAGSTFDISGKTKGEAYAGFSQRNYTNTAMKDTSAPVWGGKVIWNPSDLTSVIASMNRSIEESTLTGSSGYVATLYNARVEHALTRRTVLNANAGYETDQYKGTAIGQRKDNILTAGAGADYWLNRCFKAGLGYTYTKRDSNIAGSDYDRNAVLLRLTATY